MQQISINSKERVVVIVCISWKQCCINTQRDGKLNKNLQYFMLKNGVQRVAIVF
jgi:hypothetical protein